MGSREKYCLKWNDFSTNLQNTFKSVRNEEHLCDVTLMCGEETVKAHRLVLSASSDFFQNIFQKCQKENPVIVFKEKSLVKLSSLLDFVYNGEVRIDQDHLHAFLDLASELKVKGISQKELPADKTSLKQEYAPFSNSSSQLLQSSHTTSSNSSHYLQTSDLQSFQSYEEISKVSQGTSINKFNFYIINVLFSGYTEPLLNSKLDTGTVSRSSLGSDDYQLVSGASSVVSAAISDLGEETEEKMVRTSDGLWVCRLCGKKDRYRHNMKDHIETHESEGNKYCCYTCGKSYKTRSSLRFHKYKFHIGEKVMKSVSYVI